MLLRCFTIAALLGALLAVARPQDPQNTKDKTGIDANPPGLSFVLATKNGQRLFHLGEMIEIEEDYSSRVPGVYSLLQNPQKVEGGSASRLTILPSAAVIDRVHETGRVSAAAILDARCVGEGIGYGVGGGYCADCDGVYKLGIEPVHFPYVLNYHFAITAPGHYTIQAKAANVVSAGDVSKPLPVASTRLEIEIVRDANWSHQQLRLALDRFEEAQRRYLLNRWGAGDAGPSEIAQQMETELEIKNSAEIIRFLDTEESLREAVRLFDGSPRIAKYENAFLKAILESSHRDLAVPLLANRMADDDFLASVDFIDMLTAMTIQVEKPIAFDRDDLSSRQQLNPRTLEILRGYVLALGHSLPSKHAGVREVGMATFEHYASKEYCASEPLIEKRMADQIRLQARSKLEN
jgi:hypothetical protein